jgi:glycosyltransferase involved in cell wall biosynthesis
VPRRVLYVAWAPFFSGAERALLLTLRSLDRARVSPSLVVGTDGQLGRDVRALGIPVSVVPFGVRDSRRPLGYAWQQTRLLATMARVRPALVHANDAPSFQSAGPLARLLRIPAITHIRFPDSKAGYRWFLPARFARAIFVSTSARLEAEAEAPALFAGSSVSIYDPVESPEPMPGADRAAARASLGLAPSDLAAGLIGQVSEVKGIWDFVEAAALIAARDVPMRFVVIGDDLQTDGAVRRAMTDRVAGLGLTDRFVFTGYRPDAARLAGALDVVAAPSHVEPLGLSALEAMAAGVPVVAAAVGGLTESVVDGRTGLLVPARDPQALAGALIRLAKNPAERAAFGREARTRVREEFSLSRHAERLHALYDEVLG